MHNIKIDLILILLMTQFKVFLINTPELPLLDTFKLCCDKFLKGFKYNGHRIFEVRNLNTLVSKITDDKNNIFILGNQFLTHNKNYNNSLELLAQTYPNSWFICWFFEDVIKRNQLKFKKYILTSEKFENITETFLQRHKNTLQTYYDFIKNEKWRYVPMTFGVDLDIKKGIPPLQKFKNTKNKSAFIGTKYKKEWIKDLDKCFYYTHHEKGKFCPINEKINHLKNSVIALGFNHNDNISNQVVTDRIYEGLAYCSVVLTDNPGAVSATGGIAELVKSKEHLKERIEYYMTHHKERELKNKLGKEFLKTKGTFYHSAKNFLNVIEKYN